MHPRPTTPTTTRKQQHHHQKRSSRALLVKRGIYNRAGDTLNACIRLLPNSALNRLGVGQALVNSLLTTKSFFDQDDNCSKRKKTAWVMSERDLTSSAAAPLPLPSPPPSPFSGRMGANTGNFVSAIDENSITSIRNDRASADISRDVNSSSFDDSLDTPSSPAPSPAPPSPTTLPSKKAIMDDLFGDLNVLVQHQIPLTYFLQYLIKQTNDSKFLFFYLFAGLYTKKKADKHELLKWAYELHSTFTAHDAPLSIDLPAKTEEEINEKLEKSKIDEASLRRIFDESRCFAFDHLNQKTMLDFRSYFSEVAVTLEGADANRSILSAASSYAKAYQLGLIESILNSYLEAHTNSQLVADSRLQPTTSQYKRSDYDRTYETSLCLSCVATFIIKHCDLKRCGRYDINSVDHFLRKDKQYIFRNSQVSKRFSIKERILNNHLFAQKSFYKITRCAVCRRLLSGTGPQGFACLKCGICLDAYCVMMSETESSDQQLTECPAATASSNNQQTTAPAITAAVNNAAAANQQRKARGSKIFLYKTSSISPSSTFGPEHNFESLLMSSRERTSVDRDSSDRQGSVLNLGLQRKPNCLPNPFSPNIVDCAAPPSIVASAVSVAVQRSKSDRWPRDRPLDRLSKPSTLSSSHPIMGNSTIEAIIMNRATGSLDFRTPNHIASIVSRQTTGITEELCPINSISDSSEALAGDSDFESDSSESVPSVESVLASNLPQQIPLKELKRRISSIELYHTEKNHLKNLKILRYLFRDKLIQLPCMSTHEINKIFPCLDELINHHTEFKRALRKHQEDTGYSGTSDSIITSNRSIADIILKNFSGQSGKKFTEHCSRFLEDQRIALKIIRNKMSVPDFFNCLRIIESNPVCRKLSLKDFLPCVMSRIAKYKLLFEQILKYTDDATERRKLARCCEFADSLNMSVNEAVRRRENMNLIEEIKNNLFIKIPDDGRTIEGLENGEFVFDHRTLIYNSVLEFRWPLKDIEFETCLFNDCLVLFQRIPIPQLRSNHSSISSSTGQTPYSSPSSAIQQPCSPPSNSSAITSSTSATVTSATTSSTGASASIYSPDEWFSHRYLLQNHHIGHDFGNMDITVCPILKIDQFMIKKKAGLDNCTFFLVGKGKNCQFLIELRALNKDDCERWFEHVKRCQSQQSESISDVSDSVDPPKYLHDRSEPSSPSADGCAGNDEPAGPEIIEPLAARRSTSDLCRYLLNKLSISGEEQTTIEQEKRDCLMNIICLISTHGQLVQDFTKLTNIEPMDIFSKIQRHLDKMDQTMNQLIGSMTELLTDERITTAAMTTTTTTTDNIEPPESEARSSPSFEDEPNRRQILFHPASPPENEQQ